MDLFFSFPIDVIFGVAFTIITIVLSITVAAYQVILEGKRSSEVKQAVEQVAQTKPADIQQIAASQLELNNAYYKNVLQQSRLSFIIAVIFAGVGLGFFLLVSQNPKSPSLVGITGGTLTELLSALNFYLYGRASSQLETFHTRLDKLQFFVLANSICENLNEELKYETRAELVRSVAGFMMPRNTEVASMDKKHPREKVLAVKKQANHKEAQEEE